MGESGDAASAKSETSSYPIADGRLFRHREADRYE